MSTPSSNARQKAFRVRTAFAVGLIALPVALFLIATVVAQQASRSMASSASFQRLTAADTQPQYLLSLLLDSETSLRGYLLTGNRQHLVALDRAVPKIEPALKGLDQVTAVIPDRAREVEALRFAARHKISAIENILRLAQAGRTDAAMHMVRSGAGLKNMTEIRRIVADLTVPLGQLRVAQQQKQRRSLHMTNMLVIALLAVITVFVLLSAAMIFAYLRENERILRARDDSERRSCLSPSS